MIKGFLRQGYILRDVNLTNSTLIPERIIERRPVIRHINICNLYYKFISKLLANRLRLVLPKIISSLQSVFYSK